MASLIMPAKFLVPSLLALLMLVSAGRRSYAQQLTPTYYDSTCPAVINIVRRVLENAAVADTRICASLIRLHFHDCFVSGCDASLLLDNSPTILSEKEAVGNNNSCRGYEVIDQMKTQIEAACPGVVSCADILAIAAEESVVLAGGPSWAVPLGRLDSLTANQRSLVTSSLPHMNYTVDELKANFAAVGLDTTVDLVALSGAHTFGRVQCKGFMSRIYNFNNTGAPDPTLNATLRNSLRQLCPEDRTDIVFTDLDKTTPNAFDSAYFRNLQTGEGIIWSDQVLFSTPRSDTVDIVNRFAANETAFFESFVDSMIRMGNIAPPAGRQGEIRRNCRVVNSASVVGTISASPAGSVNTDGFASDV